MSRTETVNNVLRAIGEKQSFLITSHMDPDGDSLGSQMALFRILRDSGKLVAVVNQGAVPSRYRFLDEEGIIKFDPGDLDFTPDCAIIIECPTIERIGFVRDLIPKSALTLNIDHHPDNSRYAEINLVDPESSAVGETLFLLFEEGNLKITAETAEALYAAIISDTGRFRFSSTTPRCLEIASKLISLGANPKKIADYIYSDFSPQTIRLLGQTLSGLKLAAEGRVGYVAISADSLRKSGADMENSEGFVDFVLGISGVNLGILFKELPGYKIKVSVRSQNGYDAALFARYFNGGGHVSAAGFSQDGSLDGVMAAVLKKAEEFVNRG